MGNAQRTKLFMLGRSVAETFMGVPVLSDVSAFAADVAVLGASNLSGRGLVRYLSSQTPPA